jgi:hypothetical protein
MAVPKFVFEAAFTFGFALSIGDDVPWYMQSIV